MAKSSKKSVVAYVDPHDPHIKNSIGIVKHLKYESLIILLGLIGAAGIGCIPILLFFVLGEMVDSVSPKTSMVPSTPSPVVTAAVQIMQAANFGVMTTDAAMKMVWIAISAIFSSMLMFMLLDVAHGMVGIRLKSRYFDSLMTHEIGYFDMKRTGQLLNDMSESMEVIQEAYTHKLGEVTQYVVQIIFGLVMSIATAWKLSLVMIAFIPLFFLILMFAGVCAGLIQKNINHTNGMAANIANEVVSSIRTVRSMDGEEREKKRYWSELTKLVRSFIIKGGIMGSSISIAFFMCWGDIAMGYWYGGKLVVRGEISVGTLVKVFGYTLMAIIGITEALKRLPEFGKSNESVISLLSVIERIPILKPSGGIHLEKLEGHIEFKNVSFSYPTRPNIQVLKDFNLTIKPGQSVALVGASGSGKSTIVGLLEKFYAAESGEIYLDGTKLSEIDPRWIHRNIGIVTQEPTLFAGTIYDNILYAVQQSAPHRTITEDDVIQAAEAANAHDFIVALPDGYKTLIGERGVSLSGGQKQRIAIARAMIQDPTVLLLDEATSALDTQSESIVQDALNRLMKGRTSIVIAHRLSTVIDCDMIVVMNKGELKEKGTHADLMKIPDGHYYRLAARQLLGGRDTTGCSDTTDEGESEKEGCEPDTVIDINV